MNIIRVLSYYFKILGHNPLTESLDSVIDGYSIDQNTVLKIQSHVLCNGNEFLIPVLMIRLIRKD